MKCHLNQLVLAAGLCLITILAAPMAEKPLASNGYSDRVSLRRACPSSSCDPGTGNGINLNGVSLNGASLNGLFQNGTSFNGVNQNGANLNGTGWTQLTVTTAHLKEMPVQQIGLEGGQLVFHLRRVN
jgi:uncharacterized protein YjbI with pentapeptide repeats